MDDIVLVITQHDHAMDEIAALRRELGRNAEKIAACVVLDTAIFALKGCHRQCRPRHHLGSGAGRLSRLAGGSPWRSGFAGRNTHSHADARG